MSYDINFIANSQEDAPTCFFVSIDISSTKLFTQEKMETQNI